jgi:hypothetical protein
LHVAYVDDGGDVQTVTAQNPAVPPVLIFGGVVLSTDALPQLTRDFLALKRRFFRGRMASRHLLDDILVEVKGAELRAMVRGTSRRKRRAALRFFDDLLGLLEGHDARLIGRVWVKELGVPMDGKAVNGFSIQALAETFQHLLETRDDTGMMIIDSSSPGLNALVSHSIFTRRFRTAGDDYARLVEMPTFGHSVNHAGLQIADIVTSGLLAPMAARSHCAAHITGVHVHIHYDDIKVRFAQRVGRMQHRYQDQTGEWRGGVTISDPVGHRHGGHLFHSQCGTPCVP